MRRSRPVGPGLVGLALVGVAFVIAGVLVLRMPAATDVGVDPYDPTSSPRSWLGGLNAWTGTKLAGAGLVVLGATVLITLLGVVVGRVRGRDISAARLLVAGAVGAAVMLGSAVVFSRPVSSEISYEGTYSVATFSGEEPPPMVPAELLWSDGQVMAILLAAAGFLLAFLAGGQALGRRRVRP